MWAPASAQAEGGGVRQLRRDHLRAGGGPHLEAEAVDGKGRGKRGLAMENTGGVNHKTKNYTS